MSLEGVGVGVGMTDGMVHTRNAGGGPETEAGGGVTWGRR